LELPADEAFVLNMLGQIATWQGEKETAHELLRRSLEISRAIQDPSSIAHALEKLANTVLGTFGEYAEDKKLAEECLALCRQLQRPDWIAYTLDTLGFVTFCLGEYDEARAYYSESASLFEEIEDRYGTALALGGLGLVAWAAGGEHTHAAVHYFERSLAVTRQIGNRGQVAGRLAGLARAHIDLGEYARARRYSREALNIAYELESPVYVAHAYCGLADVALAAGDYPASRAHLLAAIQAAADAQLLPLVALALLHCAALLVQESQQADVPDDEKQRRQLQALRILMRIRSHSTLWHVFQARAAHLQEQVEATAPAAVIERVKEAQHGIARGGVESEHAELDELVREMLRELATR
jgi:tetratricopeptide (TPR) repeat protein